MSQGEKNDQGSHTVQILNREVFLASGIHFVESFDESGLLLSTEMGDMTVEGKGLKIEDFSKERNCIRICGEITGFFYSEERKEKKKLFEKLFQ